MRYLGLQIRYKSHAQSYDDEGSARTCTWCDRAPAQETVAHPRAHVPLKCGSLRNPWLIRSDSRNGERRQESKHCVQGAHFTHYQRNKALRDTKVVMSHSILPERSSLLTGTRQRSDQNICMTEARHRCCTYNPQNYASAHPLLHYNSLHRMSSLSDHQARRSPNSRWRCKIYVHTEI